jgi:hypothetical protein
MKIVGKTDGGYLCQISRYELGIIMGFGRYPEYGDTKDAFYEALGGKEPPTNSEINVITGDEYLRGVHDKILSARKTANDLRQLADMLDNPVPIIIEPKEEELKKHAL